MASARPGRPLGSGRTWSALIDEAVTAHLRAAIPRDAARIAVRVPRSVPGLLMVFVGATLPALVIGLWRLGGSLQRALTADAVAPSGDWRFELLAATSLGATSADPLAQLLLGLLYFMPLLAVALATSLVWAVVFAKLRGRSVDPGWLLTAWLFTLLTPVGVTPAYAAVGLSFGLVFGQHIFGGTGRYLVSPALLGAVCVQVAYPSVIDAAGALQSSGAELEVFSAIAGTGAADRSFDGLAWLSAFVGLGVPSLATGSAFGSLLGSALLWRTGAASLRTIGGAMLGLLLACALFDALGTGDRAWHVGWHWHAVLGTFAFGCVFLATDPSVAPVTRAGRWVYGALCGALTVAMRVLNPTHPDTALSAILIASLMIPVIDHAIVRAQARRLTRGERR